MKKQFILTFSCLLFFSLVIGLSVGNVNGQIIEWRNIISGGFGVGIGDFTQMKNFNGFIYISGSMGERSEIWRSKDGQSWEKIAIGNMENNSGILVLEDFDNFLYAGTANRTSGAQLWRTSDGINWEMTVGDGFDNSNVGIYSLVEFNNYIYAGAWCDWGGQVWRSLDGLAWEKANIDGFGNGQNVAIFSLVVFNGYLYAGTDKWTDGCEIWRTNNGTTWERVVAYGFGNSEYNDVVNSLEVYKGYIYAGCITFINGFEIWRSQDGVNWDRVDANGFGDPANTEAIYSSCFLKHLNNSLYAITTQSPRKIYGGAQVWRTIDGFTWERICDYGFGNINNTSFWSIEEFHQYLFVCTQNRVEGAEIWTTMPPIKAVEIDIKPGSDPNTINLGSQGNIPVVIFSTPDFDATTLDPTTITLANASVKLRGKGTPMASFEDVNGDGLLDIVVHVDTSALELALCDTDAILEGETFDGDKIRGIDTVRIVKE